MRKSVVLCSGGIDSTVLMYHLLHEGVEVKALSIDYGQRHRKEIDAARRITGLLNIDLRVLDISSVSSIMTKSSQTNPDVAVPHGHYASNTMAVTVVPNRNMIMLALAGAYAINSGCNEVAYAAHSGDHFIYADCRPEFVEAMDRAFGLCDESSPILNSPFINLSKSDLCRRGYELDVPLDLTWSCYEGRDLHCGKCGTCFERREAFTISGVPDPTVYRQD